MKTETMKTTIATLICVFTLCLGFAQEKNKKLAFEVNGKCEMCKMRIEKAALGVPGVKFADWNIPSHELNLVIDERKTNSMEVKMVLAEAGHDSKELKANQAAYDKIHACCKYREDNSDDSEKHK